jgi:hypothetical protein
LEGAIAVILGFLLLPGSVIVLLASNFGALKGYLIGGVAFFGFLFMLSIIWTFGVPGTPALTGPVGPLPEFVHVQPDAPEAERFPAIQQYPDGGWQPVPEDTGEEGSLASELTTAEQSLVNDFIEEHNADVEESSQEADVTNLEVETFYAVEGGTEIAAVEISPGDPIEGSGLERLDFEPVTEFAYRDPGFPNVYNYAFMIASAVLFVVHVLALVRVERRSPLGWTPQTLESEARRSREHAGV